MCRKIKGNNEIYAKRTYTTQKGTRLSVTLQCVSLSMRQHIRVIYRKMQNITTLKILLLNKRKKKSIKSVKYIIMRTRR